MNDEIPPLHFRVAEALGWTDLKIKGRILLPNEPWGGVGRPPGNLLIGEAGAEQVPRFDTDWSASGPLIEKYEIQVAPVIYRDAVDGSWGPERTEWLGRYRDPENRGGDLTEADGKTVLLAVCHLILALKASGRL